MQNFVTNLNHVLYTKRILYGNEKKSTYGVVWVEDVAPLVLDKEEAVDEDEDHGDDDHQHHHQAAVQGLQASHGAPHLETNKRENVWRLFGLLLSDKDGL